ncbi:MAG: energy transducer TonB [Xanthomonadaceae bacterium]|nr:energy transducer TonB [Xanthomonadaceae bacterium]
MATMSAYYRSYDLPWNVTDEEKQRLRRLFAICFGITLLLCVLMPLLPIPEKATQDTETVPPRFAKLVLERKVTPPPPPPPPPKVDPVPTLPEARPVPQPQEQPRPVDRTQEARQKASQAGLLPFQDQLAALRDSAVVDKVGQTKNLIGTASGTTRAERSLITSKVGTGSGGINTASLSRGYGGGAGSLSGHETTQVSSSLASGLASGDHVQRGGSGKASRSEEEIALVFDRNKGAIYSIYTRALRDKPDLQGKLVLELTISPEGAITRCEVISSELNDPELERKLVARIKMFRFEAKDVGTITVTKPIDFFPA